MYIFLHIPKAGGSTLRSVLKNQFQKKEIFEIRDRLNKKEKDFNKLLELSKNEKFVKVNKLLIGHLFFGMHETLGIQAQYLTMLRDPIKRSISNYNYIISNPAHFQHHKITSSKMSLYDFLRSSDGGNDSNRMTLILSGDGMKGEKCSSESLKKAKNNLSSHFKWVGFTEYFDESLILLKKELNSTHSLTYYKKNITTKNLSKDNIPSHVVDYATQQNKYDVELYNWALEIFKKNLEKNKDFVESEMKIFLKKQEIFKNSFRTIPHQFEDKLKTGYHFLLKLKNKGTK